MKIKRQDLPRLTSIAFDTFLGLFLLGFAAILMMIPIRDLRKSMGADRTLTAEQTQDYQSLVSTANDFAISVAAHKMLERHDVVAVYVERGSDDWPYFKVALRKDVSPNAIMPSPDREIHGYRVQINYLASAPFSFWEAVRPLQGAASFVLGVIIIISVLATAQEKWKQRTANHEGDATRIRAVR
jgi:hypothetical protein